MAFRKLISRVWQVFFLMVVCAFLVNPTHGYQNGKAHVRVSAAARFLPPDFDKQQRYSTYTSDELYDEYKDVIGINNDFVGKRVKVFGKFVPQMDDGINREFKTFMKRYGCSQPVCSDLTTLMFLDVSKSLRYYLTFQDVRVMLRFPSNLKIDPLYQSLVTASKPLCSSAMRPCLLWVKGKLDYLPIEASAPIGTFRYKVLCIDVDEYRVFEGHGNDSLESFKLGASFGMKMSDVLKSKTGDNQ